MKKHSIYINKVKEPRLPPLPPVLSNADTPNECLIKINNYLLEVHAWLKEIQNDY